MHIDIMLPRHVTICIFVGLFMSYLCDFFFMIIPVIFIFITANQIISLKHAHLLFWTLLSKVQPQGVA